VRSKSAMRLQRMKQGFTLKEMAELLSITSPFLSAIENGYEKIPRHRVSEFNEAYGGGKQ
jgi:transcriptional regulator with XRE-family HTH domain